jgi:hypothetical protein
MEKIEKLISAFEEYGVETCEDLLELYSDEAMVTRIREELRPLEWKKFTKAPILTRCLVGHPMHHLMSLSACTAVRDERAATGRRKNI